MSPSEPGDANDLARELGSIASLIRGQLELLGEAGITSLPAPPRAGTRTPRSSDGDVRDGRATSDATRARRPSVATDATPSIDPRPELASVRITQVPSLEEVRGELGDCTRCKLHERRTKLVFGVGNPKAEIVFVGEGPGEDEDKQGEPFVGRAGQLLTRIIEDGMGLRRQDVYICNIVKCRPPENREPERDEIESCLPFLEKQLAAVGPKVIVTLGRPSTSTLLGRAVSITALRGKWQEYRGIALMPTYHPAYVLRKYTADVRRQVWEDMKEVLRKIGREPPATRRGTIVD